LPTLYNTKTEREPDNHYPTEAATVNYCTALLLAEIMMDHAAPQFAWVDMGAGDGIWGTALVDMLIYTHLTRPPLSAYETRPVQPNYNYSIWNKHDIFATKWENCDAIAFGNPPYIRDWRLLNTTVAAWVENFAYTGLLLKDSFLGTKDRYTKIYSKYPLYRYFKLVSRVSFTGDGNSNADEYAFFIWKRGYQGDTPQYFFDHRRGTVDPRWLHLFSSKMKGHPKYVDFPLIFNKDWTFIE
jgi:hypothetical protein